MIRRLRSNLHFGLLLILIASCSPHVLTALPPSPAATRPGALTFYRTLTPSASPTLTPTVRSSPTPLPSPTSTPRIHRVAKGEDLITIALRYRVSLDALLAANPGVNPRAMSIGLELKIPAPTAPPPGSPAGAQAGTSLPPTPTPAPLEAGSVVCYPLPERGLLCLMPVRNNNTYPLENITAAVRLADQSGGDLRQRTAFLPLNLLLPGSELALTAVFEPPVPSRWHISGELLTAYPLLQLGDRYLKARSQIDMFIPAADGFSAEVRGSVQMEDEGKTARQVWVVVSAYDRMGSLVGYQRWESPQPLPFGQKLAFITQVFSLAGKIARVESVAEARP